jgi:HEAT repeat protein
MKQLSEQTGAFVRQLQELPAGRRHLCQKKQGNPGSACELINQIVASGERQAVIYLVPCLMAPDREIARAARQGVETLLDGIQPTLLLDLDERLRAGFWSLQLYLSNWDSMSFSDLLRAEKDKATIAVAGMASFHRNGHVRQAALEYLSGFRNGQELPYLLIRLSDWVQEVRQVAEQAVISRLSPEYLQHFLPALPLLERLKQRQRGLNSSRRLELIEQAESLMLAASDRRLLLSGLENGDLWLRRVCLKLLMSLPGDDTTEIIRLVIKDKDLTNRRSVLPLLQALPSREQQPFLSRLLKDRSASLRRQALDFSCRGEPGQEQHNLQAALTDRAAVVRDFARWKLRDIGAAVDFRDFYLSRLQDAPDDQILAAACLGLSETGSKEDAPLLAPLANHDKARIRKAAVKALADLDPPGYIDTFFQLLTDRAPGVSAQAAHALIKSVENLDNDTIWSLSCASPLWHVRRNAVRVLNHLSKWDRIAYLMLAAGQADPRVSELAVKFIENWDRQYGTTFGYSRPTQLQVEKFAGAMCCLSGKLPEKLRSTLEECLKFMISGR